MAPPQTILVIGNDLELLHLRAQVIRCAGFQVQEAGFEAALLNHLIDADVCVLVLCHSLNDHQLSVLLDQVDDARPRIRTVLLSRPASQGQAQSVDSMDIVLEQGAHPDALIRAVRRLTEAA